MAEIRRKLVIVGDGACGKTCLLMYVIPDHPNPSIVDSYSNLEQVLMLQQCLLQGNFSRGKIPIEFAFRFPKSAVVPA